MAIGVDEVRAGLSSAGKVAAVFQSQGDGTSLMVGDGINDAPALAAADVGIALGTGGGRGWCRLPTAWTALPKPCASPAARAMSRYRASWSGFA